MSDMTTNLLPIETIGKEVQVFDKKGHDYEAAVDYNLEKAEQMYKAAGLKLIEVRDRAGVNFSEFCILHCQGLSRTRAYLLMDIADGKYTLAEIRARSRVSSRKHREKKVSITVIDTPTKLVKEIKTRLKKLAKLDQKKLQAVISCGEKLIKREGSARGVR